MPEDITQIKLKFSCGENWDTMHPAANGGRHCHQCHKVVYDFTNSKADEFRTILAENNYNVCGRFTSEQMASKPFPFWKRWVSAAMVLVGVNVFSGTKAAAQNIIPKAAVKDTDKNMIWLGEPVLIEAKPLSKKQQENQVFTVVEKSPEFPGGLDTLGKFVSQSIHLKEDIAGRVIVTFIVEKNGSLSHIKVIRSLSVEADKEAIQVVKSSPKWQPGYKDGKAVRVQYTIPLMFN